jgi:RHH-type proline utilization regulon transcriptional repressor/proline dehydrogenase/delta 1-pyrroline-5-carboxylate dehydrogenase
MRPRGQLLAETGGKNTFIVTALADRDLAIKHAVHSAFGHAGQKCSAASLLICEAEVYDDPGFRGRLKDAAQSLHVGSAWDPRSIVTPLIRPPDGVLKRALTTLDPGEQWLLEPRVDGGNPALWSPGIKLGVREGSWTHETEFFGPVLGVMRADDLEHALRIANATPYGLTAALHSLDDREQRRWSEAIDVGNAYINRGSTGAIVGRQPFGGRKASNFGPGAKAGGPNYVLQLAQVRQRGRPSVGASPGSSVAELLSSLEHPLDGDAERTELRTAAESYAAAWKEHFAVEHDPSRILGQDNLFRYRAESEMAVRIGRGARPLDLSRALAAAATCGITLALSVDEHDVQGRAYAAALGEWPHVVESEQALAERLRRDGPRRIRVVGEIGDRLLEAAHEVGVHCEDSPVLTNGRIELLRYVREQVICVDYHRHGNLGDRQGEVRSPVL